MATVKFTIRGSKDPANIEVRITKSRKDDYRRRTGFSIPRSIWSDSRNWIKINQKFPKAAELESHLRGLEKFLYDEMNTSSSNGEIQFSFDDSKPMAISINQETITNWTKFLKDNPDLNLTIVAHTDKRGSEQYNMKLSRSRGKEIKRQLVKLGIDSKRISVVPRGEKDATVAESATNDERAADRTVELIWTPKQIVK